MGRLQDCPEGSARHSAGDRMPRVRVDRGKNPPDGMGIGGRGASARPSSFSIEIPVEWRSRTLGAM